MTRLFRPQSSGVQETKSGHGEARQMTIEYSPSSTDSPSHIIFDSRERRTIASYKRKLIRHRRTESELRQALAQDEALLRQKANALTTIDNALLPFGNIICRHNLTSAAAQRFKGERL
jgi:hypothetical protein